MGTMAEPSYPAMTLLLKEYQDSQKPSTKLLTAHFLQDAIDFLQKRHNINNLPVMGCTDLS